MRRQFKEKSLGYILAAFGLVAGLAWNEAIKELIVFLYPSAKNTLLAKFVYAILLTIVLVLVTIYLTRLFSKKEKEHE